MITMKMEESKITVKKIQYILKFSPLILKAGQEDGIFFNIGFYPLYNF